MKKWLVLLFAVLCLAACKKDYRVVEMENGSFRVQIRSIGNYITPNIISNSGQYFYCSDLTEKEACELMSKLIRLDEEAKKAKTVKRIVNCEEEE